jgi:hypothetical protein
MRSDPWPVSVRGIRSRGWAPAAAPAGPPINQRVPDLAKQPLYRRADGLRGARGRVLVLQARYFRTVGTSIQGHDVSETAWQTVNRAIESITTMMPVRQCGHSRNDRPVSASKRSR